MEFSDAPDDGTDRPRRGRPRSQETIQRDDVIATALNEGPLTKDKLVEKLGLKPEHVYLSLWRLRKAGKVVKVSDDSSRHLWQLAN